MNPNLLLENEKKIFLSFINRFQGRFKSSMLPDSAFASIYPDAAKVVTVGRSTLAHSQGVLGVEARLVSMSNTHSNSNIPSRFSNSYYQCCMLPISEKRLATLTAVSR